jgi:DNA-binding transcriptional ArsR family regulator
MVSANNLAARSPSAAPAFAALGDPTRLGIIVQLGKQGPLSTMTLTSATALSRQAIAKHLNVLETAGFVNGQQEGRDRIWQLRKSRLEQMNAYLTQISTQWDQALERLRDFVETSSD